MGSQPYAVASGGSNAASATLVLTVGTVAGGGAGQGTAGGDAIAVFASVNSLSELITSVADSQGNTYVRQSTGSSQYDTGTWLAVHGPGGTGATVALVPGTDTVTVTYSSATANGKNAAVAGIPSGTAADTSPAQASSAGSTTPSITSGVLGQAAEVVLAWCDNGSGGGAITWGGGFQPLLPGFEAPVTNQWSGLGYALTSATTAVTAGGTITSARWAMLMLPVKVTLPTIVTTSLPGGTAGTAYSQTLAAAGAGPFTWAVTGGSLPAGLALASSTGVISGTPSAAGSSTITVQVTDSGGHTDMQGLTIVVTGTTPAWTLVQKGTQAVTSAGNTVSPSLPAASSGSSGDPHLLVAVLITASGDWSGGMPAGWQVAADVANGGVSRATIAYAADTAGGVTSAVFTNSAVANRKAFLAEFDPGPGAVISLDATGSGLAGAVAQCIAASGPAGAGDLVIACFDEHFTAGTGVTWTDPAGFTVLGSDGASSAGNHQYAAYDLSAAGGPLSVAGKSSAASLSANAWAGALATFTVASPGGGGGGGGGAGTAGLVGAYLNPAKFGTGVTQAQAIADWQALTSRPLTVRRVYYPPSNTPSAISADLIADAAAGRKACISFRPAWNPPSPTDLARIDTFLQACRNAGLVAAVSLYGEPYGNSQSTGATPGMTMAQEIAAWRFYAPTIRQYYPTVFNTSLYAVNHHSENDWYPGDAYIDQVATDFYCSEYLGGERLDLAAALADNASPAKPFGLWEFNSSTDATKGQTQAQAQAYYNYLQSSFRARLAAGLDNADMMLFNSDSVLSQETPITTAGDYRIALWDSLFDGLNAAGAPSGAQTWHVTGALNTLTSFSAGVSGGAPPPPPPPPPPPLPPGNPVIVTTADWTFGAGPRQPAGGPALALTDARSRSATFRVAPDQYHEASFIIDGRSPQAAAFRELSSDLQLYRNGELLAALRIVPTQDSLDADSHTVSVTALDYREVLRRRLIFPDDNTFWDSLDQASIAWQMIQGTQARPGGNLGISRGLGQNTGKTRSFQAGGADFVGDDITAIAQMSGGFDWDITAYAPGDLRLDIWSPQRGSDRGVILEYGGALVQNITRAVDPSSYANSWLVSGPVPSPQPGPIAATTFWDDTPGIATDPAGRWDQAQGTQLKDQDSIRDRLAWHLADSVTVIPAYSIVMQPGTWGGPGHIWLGDLVTVRIKSGRLSVNDQLRVMEIAIAIGDDGDETVTLSAGRIPWRLEKRIPLILRRLRALETL